MRGPDSECERKGQVLGIHSTHLSRIVHGRLKIELCNGELHQQKSTEYGWCNYFM